MSIKGLLIDQGGVTLRYDNRRTVERLYEPTEVGDRLITIDGLHATIFGPGGLNELYARGQCTTRQFLERLRALPGVRNDITTDEIVNAYVDVFEPHQPMLELLSRLRRSRQQREPRLAVVSNTEPLRVERMYRMGVFGSYDKYVFSYKVRACKPDPRIYTYALRRLNVKPDEAILVDDIEANTSAAEEIGMKSFHYARQDSETHHRLLARLRSYGLNV